MRSMRQGKGSAIPSTYHPPSRWIDLVVMRNKTIWFIEWVVIDTGCKLFHSRVKHPACVSLQITVVKLRWIFARFKISMQVSSESYKESKLACETKFATRKKKRFVDIRFMTVLNHLLNWGSDKVYPKSSMCEQLKMILFISEILKR